MITNQSTTAIFFIFSFTHCKILVNKIEIQFAKKLLEAAGVEIVEENSKQDYHEAFIAFGIKPS